MRRVILDIVLAGCLTLAGLISIDCLAAAADGPPTEFTDAHADVVAWVFGLLLTGLGGLILRSIRQTDKAIESNEAEHKMILKAMAEDSDKKWDAIDRLTRDVGAAVSELNRLKGEHDVLKDFHVHTRRGDNTRHHGE